MTTVERKALFLSSAVVKALGVDAFLGWYSSVVLGSLLPPGAVPHGWVQSKYCPWSWNMNMKHANASIN